MSTSITYTPETGYQRAQELIQECKATQATTLDLGNLSLHEVPPELGDCVWLERLNLGDYFHKDEDGKWVRGQGKNERTTQNKNQLRAIPACLQKLTDLLLLSIQGNQINKIEGLETLPKLEYLNLWNNQISGIPGLDQLTNLQSLDLSGNQIKDIQGLDQLTNLQYLNLCFNQIKDIQGLDQLTNLQSLNLWNNQIKDIQGLDQLTNLQYLNLSSNQIKDIQGLDQLSKLQSLDLSGNQIKDIQGLDQLTNLQYLELRFNQIKDIQGLDQLTKLQSLDLSGNQIKDIQGLDQLTNLQYLNLCFNQIKDIQGLDQLNNLQYLDLSANSLQVDSLRNTYRIPSEVFAVNGAIGDLPSELLSNSHHYSPTEDDNCLPALKAWYSALDAAPPQDNRLFKLVVCGNGTVGKTQIINRLLGRDFEEKTDSTHGIQIELAAPVFDKASAENLQFHFWDFGGQEVYHQTHRLFLSYRAIYLVVFDAATYQAATQADPKKKEEEVSRSLSFWLSEIKARDNGSPIIVVQNKVDDIDHPVVPFQQDIPSDLLPDTQVALSAKTQHNFSNLEEAIYRQIKASKEYQMKIPASWARARDLALQLVAQAKNTQQHKLERKQFIAKVCLPAGIEDAQHQTAIIQYLHRTGVIFYDPKFLEEEIILDQQWALDAIYAILARNPQSGSAIERFQKTCRRNGGQFVADELPFDPQRYNKEDRAIFLDFMRSAGICFELKTVEEETVYQMVRGLPLAPNERTTDTWASVGKGCLHFRYQHRHHLHAGIIEQFIIRMAKHCQLHQLWRNGALVNWGRTSWAWVNVNYLDKEISIAVAGQESLYLLQAIRNTFQQIQGNNSTITAHASIDGERWVALEQLAQAKKHEAKTVDVLPPQGGTMEWKVLEWALQDNPEAGFDKKSEDVTHEVKMQTSANALPEKLALSPQQEIKQYLREGHIDQALECLVSYYPETAQLQGEFSRIRKQYLLGTLTEEVHLAAQNRLDERIRLLAEELEGKDAAQQKTIATQAGQDIKAHLDRIEPKIDQVLAVAQDTNHRIQLMQQDIPVILRQLEEQVFSRESLEAFLAHTQPLISQLMQITTDAQLKKQADDAANPELTLTNKFKLTIPLIPGILQYEKEISGKPLNLLRAAWGDLKAGSEEGLKRLFLQD